jgi:hypothetical protein
MANRIGVESSKVTSVIVEASEYRDLVRKYQVSGAPKTMVSEKVEILGTLPQDDIVRTAVGASGTSRLRDGLGPLTLPGAHTMMRGRAPPK